MAEIVKKNKEIGSYTVLPVLSSLLHIHLTIDSKRTSFKKRKKNGRFR
jgi:hypothetical protein